MALNGVDISIKEGEFVSILGPSGSGKSTLLNLLGALDKPTSGSIKIDDVNLSKLRDHEISLLQTENWNCFSIF